MKCAVHNEVDATGYCRNCGKALCPACTREVRGMLYCESCLADLLSRPQPTQGGGNPALATLLGFVPGLGAVYNAQYMKALVHVLVFAAFVGFLSGGHPDWMYPVGGILLSAFIVYMAIDANRSAKARA
ncbi:MAG: B-box zinc finger protein, partial [Bryobacteraceae bacterium]